jgi:uncharacterized protein with PIN domain
VSGLVIDTSAAMAILSAEPSADELLGRLAHADERFISAGTLIELGIVLEARIGPRQAASSSASCVTGISRWSRSTVRESTEPSRAGAGSVEAGIVPP